MRGLFCVYGLSQDMLHKLDINEHKGGWDKTPVGVLITLLKKEVDELSDAVNNKESAHNIGLEAADVACFAMMVADRCGAYADRQHYMHRKEGVLLNPALASDVLNFVRSIASDNYDSRQAIAHNLLNRIWHEEKEST